MKRDVYYDEGGSFVNFLLIVVIVICMVLIGYFGYMVYQNIPGSPENLRVDVEKLIIRNQSLDVRQFFPNMKFNHNNISFSLDLNCKKEKKDRMIESFKVLSESVPVLSFIEIGSNGDIEISCSQYNGDEVEKSYFVAGEGGAKEIIPTGLYNVIETGVVLLYKESKDSLKCDYPNVELHELMHVFGFNHTGDKTSLMYPYLESCDQKLDLSIVNELKRLYSEENLAELYFDDVQVIKKGKYIDFNLTIKNSGIVGAENVTLSVFDEDNLIETKSLNDIKYGAGVFFDVKNLKLINYNPKEIRFVIDKNNLVREYDKKNNIVTIKF